MRDEIRHLSRSSVLWPIHSESDLLSSYGSLLSRYAFLLWPVLVYVMVLISEARYIFGFSFIKWWPHTFSLQPFRARLPFRVGPTRSCHLLHEWSSTTIHSPARLLSLQTYHYDANAIKYSAYSRLASFRIEVLHSSSFESFRTLGLTPISLPSFRTHVHIP